MPKLINLRAALAGLAMAVMATAIAVPAQAGDEVFTRDGYAVSGFDVVSYFEESGPVPGDDAHVYEHDGAVYRFASAENLETFAADPEAYTPAYGGFCAYGTANGYKVPVDPYAYTVVDGVLYLNLNDRVQGLWEQDIPGYIRGADNNWPLIVSYSPDELRSGDVSIDGLTLGAQ